MTEPREPSLSGPDSGPAGSRVPDPVVSAVIPCLNEVATIGATIESLQRQTRTPDEIVVVDGASTDGTLDLLERLRDEAGGASVPDDPRQAPRAGESVAAPGDPPVRAGVRSRLLVLVDPGASIPHAVNAGVRAASGTVIVRMDAHAHPAPDYIERALVRLAEPRAGVVGGVWRIAPGAATATAAAIARAVSHPLGAGDAAYRTARANEPRMNRGFAVARRAAAARHGAAARDVDTVPFGCFTRDLWASLGGLDERLPVNEDYEFNYRVRASGLRVILDPAVKSTYFARPTLWALARQYVRYGWWKARMLRRHPGSLRWRQAVPAAFVAGLVGLSLLGVLWAPAWWALAGLVGLYGAMLGAASFLVCAGEGGWRRLLPLVAAFAIVHVTWGAGFVASLAAPPRRA